MGIKYFRFSFVFNILLIFILALLTGCHAQKSTKVDEQGWVKDPQLKLKFQIPPGWDALSGWDASIYQEVLTKAFTKKQPFQVRRVFEYKANSQQDNSHIHFLLCTIKTSFFSNDSKQVQLSRFYNMLLVLYPHAQVKKTREESDTHLLYKYQFLNNDWVQSSYFMPGHEKVVFYFLYPQGKQKIIDQIIQSISHSITLN